MLMIGVIAAAGADEQQPLGERVGQHEGPFDAAQADDRPGLQRPAQERRDLAALARASA